MYAEDFSRVFFEFLHEYSDDADMLNTLKPFIEYAWGSIEVGGVQTRESMEKQLEMVAWMADSGASMDAVKSAIKLMTE